jgi:hypothetical protein
LTHNSHYGKMEPMAEESKSLRARLRNKAMSIYLGLLEFSPTYRGAHLIAYTIQESALRTAFVSNFSRFGDWENYRIAVINGKHGWFVRDGALWLCDMDDEEPVKYSARPVDLVTVDSDMLKEAMAAVDVLHGDFNDLVDDEEE